MERYKITIVSPDVAGPPPSLLVPFQPSALVTAFVDELFTRLARQNLPLSCDTHTVSLHLDSSTGPIIDIEDVLSDILSDPRNEKIVAVFSKKSQPADSNATPSLTANPPKLGAGTPGETGDLIAVRITTPATAKDRTLAHTIHIAKSATLRELHSAAAASLNLPATVAHDDHNECNCSLAAAIARGPSPPDHFFVVYGKSQVQRFGIGEPTPACLKAILRLRLGTDLEDKKKVRMFGAEHVNDNHMSEDSNPSPYTRSPVVAVCSKARHIPQALRSRSYDSSDYRGPALPQVLDLHTSELPINPASLDLTIAASGLGSLIVDNTLDLYAVYRHQSEYDGSKPGMNTIYRHQPHWNPPVSQSERGRAMFLSTLRVFASLVHEMDDSTSEDAALHVLDVILRFPPALRTFKILFDNKTPSQSESAALSHAMYEFLDQFMPTQLIGTDHTRIFECSRLFFGFVLEKTKSLKLPNALDCIPPYDQAFKTVQARDYQTGEATKDPILTSDGLIEKALHLALQSGPLADSHLAISPALDHIDEKTLRAVLLSAGTSAEITVFWKAAPSADYPYPDRDDATQIFSALELADLSHLAACCGRNKLGVYKPRQLASAPNPCLAFDRQAHVAVYLGSQGCGGPGDALLQFRPVHGEENINAAVIEQLIDPLLRQHESDGTSVLDAIGDAKTKRMQQPDEILCFVVDLSASMRHRTDFADATDDQPTFVEKPDGEALIEPELYAPENTCLEDLKRQLINHEAFNDMVAIVAANSSEEDGLDYDTAVHVLRQLRSELLQSLILKNNTLRANRYFVAGRQAVEHECNKLKAFAAGLRTHQDTLADFLLYRASVAASMDLSSEWAWSIGDAVPPSGPMQRIPTLPEAITEIPHELKDPISGDLIQDAVTALDGHTYARASIQKWFDIRLSSPMTGLRLEEASLRSNAQVNNSVTSWVNGEGVMSAPPPTPANNTRNAKKSRRSSATPDQPFEITFMTPTGSFQRYVTGRLMLRDLYVLAFRGMCGRHAVFQLVIDSTVYPLAAYSAAGIAGLGAEDGTRVEVRIATDEPGPVTLSSAGRVAQMDKVLIKVYSSNDQNMDFAYWMPQDTTHTLASVMWKARLHFVETNGYFEHDEEQVWTNMESSGDGLLVGHPSPSTNSLSTYLQRSYCHGVLGDEALCAQSTARYHSLSSTAPLVLKVWIARPPRADQDTHFTRLDVLKQMFEALINRMVAYDYKTHVGLVSVSSKAKLAMQMSHVIENFRKAVSSTRADGDTALWDGIALARDQINETAKKWPEQTKKRIIVISDGVDTKSASTTSRELAWSLHQDNIVLDSVSIGFEYNSELRAMSSILGGYTFHPTSVANALQICELEPVLCLLERPDIKTPQGVPAQRSRFLTFFWNHRSNVELTEVNEETVPARREHVGLQDEYILLTPAATSRPGAVGVGNSTFRVTRLMNEMRQLVTQERHPKFDIYVSESNLAHWKIVMEGPDDSPYSAGTFLLFMAAGEHYPSHAPEIRFVTKMMHPNVNNHGRICHSVLSRDWVSDMSMGALLNVIFGLLLQPEASDLVTTSATLDYHHDQVEWEEAVRAHVARYASKTRAEWKTEILAVEDVDESE